MLKNPFLAMYMVLMIALVSCEKPAAYDRAMQLKLDVDSIERFVKANGIAVTNDGTGLFSQILTKVDGKDTLAGTDMLTVTYTGRLLNGVVVERLATPDSLLYSSVTEGWRNGLKKIPMGGRIRLIIPSSMAYTNKMVGLVPANSNLDYTIDLIKITKLKIDKTK